MITFMDNSDKNQLEQSIDELKGDLDKLNEGGLNLKDEVIAEDINNWLDEHPEATTTVQDDSIGLLQLTKSARKKIYNVDNSILAERYSPTYESSDLIWYKSIFDFWAECGFKKYIQCVYLIENCDLKYNINDLKTFIYNRRNEGFKCNTLKFHCHKNNVGDLATNEAQQENYERTVLNTIDSIDGIERVVILNERKDTTIQENTEWLLSIIEKIKRRGISVSISFGSIEYLNLFIKECNDVADKLDFYSVNYYPFVSTLCNDTTEKQFVNAFDSINLYADYIKTCVNEKPFIISEMGVIPYNEALTSTWKYNPEDTELFPNGATYNPTIPLNYIKGFEKNEYNRNIDEVWGWFSSQVIYKNINDANEYISYFNSVMGG